MLPEALVVIRPADTPVVRYRDLLRIRARCPSCWPRCIAYELERDDLGNGTALISYRFLEHARAAALRSDLAGLDPDELAVLEGWAA